MTKPARMLFVVDLFRKILTSVLLVGTLSLCASAQSGASWLDPSWVYRVPVTVTNVNGSSLPQFQVQITLDSSFDFPNASPSGSDVRVTDSDGLTLLPFWIQAWSPQQATATVWARVPNVPANGTTIFLYYGNPAATSTSSGDGTFDFFDDFSYTTSTTQIKTAAFKAVSWITRAHDATSRNGVSYFFDLGSNAFNSQGYPEVTGYIIPTMYDAAAATSDPNVAGDLRTRAQQMADWEVRIQPANGSGQYVFDTGQIVDGLVRAYQETGNGNYLTAASRYGDWLISVQAADGSWPGDYGGFAKPYHARVSRALLLLWQAGGASRFRDAAIRNLNWDLTQQQSNGWFNNLGLSSGDNPYPLTHTIGYTIEGLLDSGIILNNSTYITAAKKTADALLAQQEPDGSLSGARYQSDWTTADQSQCLTGSAQTALSWLKFYQYTVNQGSPDARYLNGAVKMNQYLLSVQGNSSNPGIDGGLPGSDPISGPYMTNTIPSWATKFLADDLLLESKYVTTAPVSALNPAKWSFPAGQGGFSSVSGVLKYNDLAGNFGTRAIAMKSGSPFVFSDGIVEYNQSGDGGNSELGLMYRGQNPESNNSYEFYPSIWNAQNDWNLYANVSANQNYMANSNTGSFTPHVLYGVKAAIGGASHTFWISGSQVFSTSDSTFTSGTIGFMDWGTAIDWISNFRIRKFALVEPTTAVGAEQVSSPGVASLTLNPPSVAGGVSSTGTVTLNLATGGTVALASSNTSIATVQGTVTIPSGMRSANFPVNTVPNSMGSVTISASFSSSTKMAVLQVTAAVQSVTVNPGSVVGGNGSTGTVTLNGAAPAGGAVVTLSSNSPSIASVPASVTIAQGTNSASFPVTTAGVAASSSVTISASYGGSSQNAGLTVTRADLLSLTLNPTSVVGGSPSTGTVTLNGAAPSGGAIINLSSSNTAVATVQSTVTVAQNTTQATFTVTTSSVSSPTSSTISGTYNSVMRNAVLNIGAVPWMNTSWLYRRPVNVGNPTGGTLTNFQVNVLLDSSFSFSKAQNNGGDVRFTASDGVTLLPFWIESWNSAGLSASIWVQVPSIPASGTTIFLYYGNSAATSASNGTATFIFFDDFSFTSGGVPALDPNKWSFPAGSAGFSNIGGMLQYNAPSGGFGPRAVAKVGGSNLVFGDGIVEYNLQSNGGFDEMGLLYRGQNPETANSYVFYPSIYIQQNRWLLYARISSGSVNLGSGGAFAPGTWYRVKAAVGGSSHIFSINGTQIFTANNSAFSSGDVGLLAWGNTVSWVSNFKVRKYASSEPTAAVGGEQPQH